METVRTIEAAIKIIDGVRKIDPARQDALNQAMVLLYAAKIEVTETQSVLQKIIDAFPEMDNDEPINGSDAVDILCGLWREIKGAAK